MNPPDRCLSEKPTLKEVVDMVEVFKTDVEDKHHAERLIDQIHQSFTGYRANFDLEDCDNILRIKSASGGVEAQGVISLLQNSGFTAEVLPD